MGRTWTTVLMIAGLVAGGVSATAHGAGKGKATTAKKVPAKATVKTAPKSGAGEKAAAASPAPSPAPATAGATDDAPAGPSTAPPPARVLTPATVAEGTTPALALHPPKVVNGGVTLAVVKGLRAGDEVTGTFNGQAWPFASSEGGASALIGIDLDVKTGTYPVAVTVKRADGSVVNLAEKLPVEDAGYEVEKLTLPPSKVTGFDEATLTRIRKDQRDFGALWPAWNLERHWTGAFVKPVPGSISSEFGGRRVINGEPRSPHSGIDQRGAVGTPIVAINDARVAYVGDHFFSGNVTVLDHGQGVYSVYAHQSKVLVKPEQRVKRGEKIGEIGMTGRASGPHLHWGLRVNQARIDPVRLLELDMSPVAGAPAVATESATPVPGGAGAEAAPLSVGSAGTL